MEATFTLKLMSKHSLSQDIVDDIIQFSKEIHKSKIKYINHQLKKKFGEDTSVVIKKGEYILDKCIQFKKKTKSFFFCLVFAFTHLIFKKKIWIQCISLTVHIKS